MSGFCQCVSHLSGSTLWLNPRHTEPCVQSSWHLTPLKVTSGALQIQALGEEEDFMGKVTGLLVTLHRTSSSQSNPSLAGWGFTSLSTSWVYVICIMLMLVWRPWCGTFRTSRYATPPLQDKKNVCSAVSYFSEWGDSGLDFFSFVPRPGFPDYLSPISSVEITKMATFGNRCRFPKTLIDQQGIEEPTPNCLGNPPSRTPISGWWRVQNPKSEVWTLEFDFWFWVWGFEFWIGVVSIIDVTASNGAVLPKNWILHKINVNRKPRRPGSADV